jgi:4-hydroxy-2-oxoheptanedioate aldolase
MLRPPENRFKRAVKAGELQVGVYCDTLHPTLVEALATAGVDFVVLDTEHNGYDLHQCTESVRAAELFGITALIRVWDNNPRLINKALETGAAGVVVPHVDTPELARQAVRATKYPPEGDRGVHPGTRAAGFGGNWGETWQRANQESMVVLQPLESLDGIKNLDEILQVPGIDLISLGTADISQVLGAPGRAGDPKVQEAREQALELCKQHGVPAYALTGARREETRAWYDKGVRTFLCGSDVGFVLAGARGMMTAMRQAVE